MRRNLVFLQSLQGLGRRKTEFFTGLWNKPETRDERVKEYVPEVLEESLAEQRALLEESTSRDVIVELGHKILLEMENKSPTPSIAPHMSKLLKVYGAKDIIAQRPLSYLLYPSSNMLSSGGEPPHELIGGFGENFRQLVEQVEQNGCSIRKAAVEDEAAAATPQIAASTKKAADEPNAEESDSVKKSGKVGMTPSDMSEPVDITMFVKVASGMALANLQCGDVRSAVRCVDAGLAHAQDHGRIGGLLSLRAGLLVRQKKYAEAAECAKLAVEASSNIQGYLHGAYALKMLDQPEALVEFLESACADYPADTGLSKQLETAKKELKMRLTK